MLRLGCQFICNPISLSINITKFPYISSIALAESHNFLSPVICIDQVFLIVVCLRPLFWYKNLTSYELDWIEYLLLKFSLQVALSGTSYSVLQRIGAIAFIKVAEGKEAFKYWGLYTGWNALLSKVFGVIIREVCLEKDGFVNFYLEFWSNFIGFN